MDGGEGMRKGSGGWGMGDEERDTEGRWMRKMCISGWAGEWSTYPLD